MEIRNPLSALIKRITEDEENELKHASQEASKDKERTNVLGVWESLDAEGWN